MMAATCRQFVANSLRLNTTLTLQAVRHATQNNALSRGTLVSQQRNVSTSKPRFLKEIQVRTTENVTTVEGIIVESDRKGKVLEVAEEEKGFCPLCPHRLNATLKYTDVLILSQFLRADGCALPRSVTGLCQKAQHNLQRLVNQAQRAGLMPELRPDHWKGVPRTQIKSKYKWKQYNTYFDD